GGGPGVNAMLEMDVAGGHTIVVLSNFDPPTASRIIQEISAMLRAIAAAESGGQLYRIGVECASTEPTVVQFGAMRDVMREGYTESRIHLADAVTQPHAFAIGALESLSGEITIIDGDVWVSRAADDGLQVTGPEPIAEDQATLLTLAHVAKWQSVTIERAVEGHELELLIEKTARTRGIDTAEPFAFLIEGELGSLDLHVINGYCPIGTNPATVDAKPWR
ncbi:MAG: hypothetical protein O7G85_14935, partial [Planctomycetota bacterium]|nr:hypothetical protein [Planctomycetota bacterium]